MATKQEIISAIKSGNYKVTIEEPNNFELCTRGSGKKYYVLHGDTEKFSVDAGSCTVEVAGLEFTCDLNFGEWSGNEFANDEEVISALERADGVLFGIMLEPEEQWQVFAAANGIKEEMDYYWCEDEDMPRAADDLSFSDIGIYCKYAITRSHGASSEWNDLDIDLEIEEEEAIFDSLSDSDKEALLDYDMVDLGIEEIKNISEELCRKIEDAMKDAAADNGYEGDGLTFLMTITNDN